MPKFDPLNRKASRIIAPRPVIEEDESEPPPVIKQEPVDVVFGERDAESEADEEVERDRWRVIRERPDDDIASGAESVSSVEVEEVDDSDDETFDPSRPELLGKRRMPFLTPAGKRLRLSKRDQPAQLAETGKLYALAVVSDGARNLAEELV